MATIFLRFLFLSRLLNAILLFLVPKKVRAYLPHSWYSVQQQQQQQSPPSDDNLGDNNNITGDAKQQQQPLPPAPNSQELRRVFQMFDRNGDGRITKEELSHSLETMGIFIPGKDLSQMIGKIDVDGDGCVDIDEFRSLYQTIMNNEADEDMREAFDVFDQNGDGFIAVNELKSVLTSLGLKQGLNLEECVNMIKKVDVDGDGMVNFEEFKEMMKASNFSALN